MAGCPLRALHTPVIAVCSFGEASGKFELQLAIGSALKAMGYRVSQVGTRSYSSLLGFPGFPAWLFEGSVRPGDRVRAVNEMVVQLEDRERPDILVVGVPGGFSQVPFCTDNDFGVFQEQFFIGLNPDLAIPVFYFSPELEEVDMQKGSAFLARRFGPTTLGSVVSNAYLDLSLSQESKRAEIAYIGRTVCSEVVRRIEERSRVWSLLDPMIGQSIARQAVTALSGAVEGRKRGDRGRRPASGR
jgi:peptide maturation system protein (TIGR04066 family)